MGIATYDEIRELAKPGLLRLIDYPIALEAIEKAKGGMIIDSRYPENGVLLNRKVTPHGDGPAELYLSRSGCFLVFRAVFTKLPDGSVKTSREFDHVPNPHELYEDWLSPDEALVALREILRGTLDRSQERLHVLRHYYAKTDRLIRKKEATLGIS